MSSDAIIGLVGGLTGVVLGWALTYATDRIRARVNRRKRARYLATRISIILSEYIRACAWVAQDDGYGPGNPDLGDNQPQEQVEQPPIPDYPSDVDWNSIDYSLMVQLLALPVKARAANHQIRCTLEVDAPLLDDFFAERQVQYSCLGISALQLKKELEKICGPITGLNIQKDEPKQIFEARIKEYEARERRRQISSAAEGFGI